MVSVTTARDPYKEGMNHQASKLTEMNTKHSGDKDTTMTYKLNENAKGEKNYGLDGVPTKNTAMPDRPLSQIHPPEDYRLSWADELKRSPNGPVPREKLEEDDDDDFFQSSVDRRAVDNVRMLIVDAVQHAQAGHPGMALGMADVAYHLYRHVMRYNPENPRWFNRDRFVLSAGHGCLLQYVCLHLAGFESVQIIKQKAQWLEDLKRLCKLGSRTPGHPENAVTAGVEVTTGPLGQGVANAVGLALAEAHLAARFNKPDAVLVDHRTYCIMGDGDAMEGISNEAASLAAHWKLNKLTLIYDDNHNTIDGDTNLAFSEDVSARFEALGWNTITVDNIHQKLEPFKDAIRCAHNETGRPTFIKAW
ncbi:hypothetical protein BHE74_00039226 [Ensete ventricosum]|nr:hypothetical protein BHE74_00039226 [Ensete ventricosum]